MPKTELNNNRVNEKIAEMKAPEVLKKNFMPYAMSVIVSRAIPEIDGLKPSHRKLLYTMYDMGLISGIRTKSANIAARTMLLNPHGDQACYETMVRMTQNNETLLTPLVDGKGNFGKHYCRDMSFAASRYTEAKLMPVAHEFFDSIRKDTVDFVDNYDSTRKEPTLLPVTFPNILANPTEGIAVGLASSIPSFNLSELCDATIMRIQEPETDIRTVMPAPDFTTGAFILLDNDTMDKIYKTGRGSIKMRAKYNVDTKNRIIEVTEIPYSTTAEAIIEGIIALVKSGKIKEVNDVRNEIDLKGFKIAIDYKRGVDPDALMQKLFKLTKLEDNYSCNMTVLIDGIPREIGVIEILDEWIKWRRNCVKRELTFDLKKKMHDLHILKGLVAILADLDKAIRIIRETETDEEVVPNLMKGFDIDEEQASYIAEIKLRNLNKDYFLNKTNAITGLENDIALLNKQLGSEREINRIIINTLKNVKKKYGRERKTVISEYVETSTEEVIENYPVHIYLTKEGYIKKVPSSSLKNDPIIKVKEGDEIINSFDAENISELLMFTNHCNVYKLYCNEMTDRKPSELGDYISNLYDQEENEEILFICPMVKGQHIIIGFENGKTAKIPVSAYETKQKRKKLINGYSNLSKPLGFFAISEEEDFYYTNSKGKVLGFSSALIPVKTTKATQGVQTIRPARGAVVTSFNKGKAKYNCRAIPSSAK